MFTCSATTGITAGGLLRIEDVLPFFPDFVTIDNFKDAICDSLERYNKQVCMWVGGGEGGGRDVMIEGAAQALNGCLRWRVSHAKFDRQLDTNHKWTHGAASGVVLDQALGCFAPAIVTSQTPHACQIEELKWEMEEATAISEAVRADLAALGTRAAVVALSEPCARCGQPIGMSPPPAAASGLPTSGAHLLTLPTWEYLVNPVTRA
jgi:hypothetical protein